MYVSRKLCTRAVFVLASLASLQLLAQEPMPTGGGRRGRGGAGTREFLGLGPAPDAAAAKKGEPVYLQNCATCHGKTGRGAQGPNLVRSVTVLHDEKDEEIGPVIKNGRPQAGMPAFPGLSQDDVHNVSQFLKLQVELAANRGTYGQTYAAQRSQTGGDAKKGAAFFGANCSTCHSVTGDLAKIGARFSQAPLMQSRFLWPTSPGQQKATVTTLTGETIAGTIRQMDDFNVSLTDTAGDYHSWPLDKVKVHVDDKLAGHRALLPKYTDADIHDLAAYLTTIK